MHTTFHLVLLVGWSVGKYVHSYIILLNFGFFSPLQGRKGKREGGREGGRERGREGGRRGAMVGRRKRKEGRKALGQKGRKR